MDHPAVIVLVTVAAAALVLLLLFLALGGSDARRRRAALGSFTRALRDDAFAARVEALLAAPKPEAAKPARPSGVPLRMLALLQREGRLLDFLLEDIQAYPDAQVGAAVRDIHRQCRAAIQEHLALEPVISQAEGATVEVPAGFDPSAVRLVGNVTGQPPFKGTLQHHGWRVREMKLAAPPEGQDELVLMPAEVELP